MHYLYVFRIDFHADLLTHVMLVVVLQQPFYLAVLALHQHLVVYADEQLGNDSPVPLSLAVRHYIDVLRPYNDVDTAARREAFLLSVDTRIVDAVYAYYLLVHHLTGQDVAVAYEVGNEGVDRLIVDLLRRALLLDVALVHDDYLV